jgi:hypothetical protein
MTSPTRHALLLAAGEFVRISLGEVFHTEQRQRFAHARSALAACQHLQPEADVVGDGQMREQRVALEHVADPSRLGRYVGPGRGVEEDAPVHDDASRVGSQEAGHALQRECLAGAGGAEEGGDATVRRPLDVEREVGQALHQADLEPRAHAARAPSRLATTSTTHDSAVRIATRNRAACSSPVCTAV